MRRFLVGDHWPLVLRCALSNLRARTDTPETSLVGRKRGCLEIREYIRQCFSQPARSPGQQSLHRPLPLKFLADSHWMFVRFERQVWRVVSLRRTVAGVPSESEWLARSSPPSVVVVEVSSGRISACAVATSSVEREALAKCFWLLVLCH